MLHDGVHLATVDTVPASHVGSSIGAGDRFCGALLLALLEGALLAEAVATASHLTADWLARQAPPR
jgi:sugar/nucleoside kinase (ribokinase family)